MSYSIRRYTGTGAAQVLDVPPYLDQSHIKVYVAGALNTSWSWVTSSTITITATNGASVVIQRLTSPAERLTDYLSGAPLTEAALDQDSLQAFYLAQEARDIYDDLVGYAAAPLDTAIVAAAQANISAGLAAASATAAAAAATANAAAIATLNGASGSNSVGFVQAGTGAVTRTVRDKLRERVTLEDFGGIGNGSTVGQQAYFALALAAVAAGGTIDLQPGSTYLWSASTTVNKKVTIRGNGATIKFDAAYNVGGGTLEAFLVSAADVTFDGVIFDATGAPVPSTNSRFVWSTAARTTIRNCTALALPAGTSNVQCAFGSSIASSEFTVSRCYFNDCPGAAFTQGPRALFDHNRVTAPKDVSFALNSTNCVGAQVLNNSVVNLAGAVVSGHILAEEGASDWQFIGNYVYGVKNGIGIGAVSPTITTVVDGGLIQNNIVDGGGITTTAASALISITAYFRRCKIEGNQLKRMPAGLAGNAAIVAPLLRTRIADNCIDATTGTSAAAAVVLQPAGGVADIVDNFIECTGGPSRVFVFGAGSNSGFRVLFQGGSFIGGSEGINTSLNSPTNMPLWLENISECSATAFLNLAGTDSMEDFFNSYGAISFPHTIKANRTMVGNAAPTAGTWAAGDTVWINQPVAGGVPGWRCTVPGTPGTWKAMAAIAA